MAASRRSNNQSFILTGIDDIDRRLQTLALRKANSIARAAINKGLTETARHIRSAVDAEPGISPKLKKALKQTVGKRFRRKRSNGEVAAKAGFGVAKKQGKSSTGSRARGKGVGIGWQNAHWFALGTSRRRHKSGRNTGRIKQVLAVRRAYRKSRTQALAVIRSTALRKLEQTVKEMV